jgi:glycosyltransferase involved in cell wall biosynthesis
MQNTTFPIEILIHDDCSTDGTDAIIKEYAEKYPDIVKPLFETENKYSNGYRGKMDITFNYSRAQGKYIASCEGDDYWTDPLKLQKQVDFMEVNPEYSVTFHRCKHYNVVDNSTKEDQCGFLFKNDEEGVEITVDMFFEKWITQPFTMVFRVDMIDFKNMPKYEYYRDMHEIYHLLMNGKGYLFGFDGGVRIMHGGGIHSLTSELNASSIAYVISQELYKYNKNKYVEQYYYITMRWCYDVAIRHNNLGLALKYNNNLLKLKSSLKLYLKNSLILLRSLIKM